MRGLEVSGKCGDGFLVLVYDDVDDICKLCHARRGDHVGMDGIAVKYAGAGIRAVDEFRAMVAEHRDLIGYAGQHAFAAAGETGKEMRLDKALGDEQLRLRGEPVDNAGRARGQD